MKKPAVVVFDLGKVLLDFNYALAIGRLEKQSRLNQAAIHQLLMESLLFEYETGRISTQVFFDKMCASTGYCGSLQDFAHMFGDIFHPIPEMIHFQAKLKHQGIPTFIFSNTNELAIEHIRKTYPFFHGFDDYILSYEHGSMKPDVRLYEVVEEKTGRSGSDILYIDDRPENIETGRARGWHSLCHVSPAETIAEAERLFDVNQQPEKT